MVTTVRDRALHCGCVGTFSWKAALLAASSLQMLCVGAESHCEVESKREREREEGGREEARCVHDF